MHMRIFKIFLLSGVTALIAACAPQTVDPLEKSAIGEDDSVTRQLDAIAQEVWAFNLELDLAARRANGLLVSEIADISREALEARAVRAQQFLDRIDHIDAGKLSHSDRLTAAYLKWFLRQHVDAPQTDQYMFAMAPYSGGYSLSGLFNSAVSLPLQSDEERGAYLNLLAEFADLLDQSREKTRRQAEAGIYFPRPAIPGAVGLLSSLRDRAEVALIPDGERLEGLSEEDSAGFQGEARARVEQLIVPAFDKFIESLGPDYIASAPETVGLSQYPGGLDEYRRRINYFTGTDLSPEELHEIGHEKMDEVRARMAELRAEIGFDGTEAEFHKKLRTDRKFLAETPDDVAELYMYHIGKIEPIIADYFSVLPQAPYGVERADPAIEAGLSFGYFQVPTETEPRGLYIFNGSGLDQRSQVNAASLIFHELIPGHHFHLALQAENESLPKIRRRSGGLGMSAFSEGWAEYASKLGYEMGLYDDPYDEYGQLVAESFLIARIILDTGMNALGWTLEDARDLLADNPFLSDAMIATETLRYSTDIPGQALAYKLGDYRISDLRRRAEERLGDRFDIRDFHAVILGEGSLPLELLDDHVDWYIETELAKN